MLLNKLLIVLTTLTLFILLFVGYFHPITAITQDLGRHLLTGQIIWQTHHVPKINLFSYTYPTFLFINHHWLSEVTFYFIHQFIGFNGLLVVTTCIILLAFGLLFSCAFKQKSTNIIAFCIASLLYLTILFERTDVRPELFSFLFLSVFLVILFKNRKKPTNWLFLLIPIEFLWVNMHIYFFVGIILLISFLADEVIRSKGAVTTKAVVQLGFITFLCGLVTVANPNGIPGALYPFHVFQNYGYAIEENQNIFFLQGITNNSIIPLFEFTVVLLFLVLFITIKRTRPVDWLLSGIFTIIGMTAIRNLPIFIFATFIPFVRSLSFSADYIFTFLRKKIPTSRIVIQNSFLFLLFVITIWQIIITIQSKHTSGGVITGAQKAADFYIQHHITGPVFNNFDIGSYLEYRIYPNQKVFIDGRPEAYPSSFFANIYRPMQENNDVFNAVDKRYHFHSIFFAHTDGTPWAASFLKNITTNPAWKVVYLDDTVVILAKNIPENKSIITQFGMDENNTMITNLQKNNIDSLFQLAHFFNEVGWTDQEFIMYQDILSLHPNQCNALYNAILILQSQQSPLTPIFNNRYAVNCR